MCKSEDVLSVDKQLVFIKYVGGNESYAVLNSLKKVLAISRIISNALI